MVTIEMSAAATKGRTRTLEFKKKDSEGRIRVSGGSRVLLGKIAEACFKTKAKQWNKIKKSWGRFYRSSSTDSTVSLKIEKK